MGRKKTKLELGILYASDYNKLKSMGLIEKIKKSVKASIVYQMKLHDLQIIEHIYKKYEPKVVVDLNCSKCIMKMIHKMNKFISRYE